MTDTDVNNETRQEHPAGATQTASQMLVQAREAKGLSQREVADQLFLSATFIRYIDDGDFHKLPKQAFIKGYLRSYARAVSLDGPTVVAAYERDQNIAPLVPEIGQVTEEAVGSGAFTGPVVQTGIVGLGLIFVVAALVWWLSSGTSQEPPSVTENDSAQLSQTPSAQLPKRVDPGQLDEGAADTGADTVEAAPVALDNSAPGNSAPGSSAPVDASTTNDASQAAAPAAGAPTADANQTPKAGDVQIERKQDGDKQLITVTAGGTDKMAFSFTGECWVEITDGRGEQIYGDLNRAGDDMTVYGVAPFEVLLGKAPAVTMTWQGKSVDLSRYTTKDQTAKVRTARL